MRTTGSAAGIALLLMLISVVGLHGQVLGNGGGSTETGQSPGVFVPSDYVIGPEDILGVMVWRETEVSGDFTVRSDGRITIPLVGDIQAAGKRPEALASEIETSIGEYLTAPNVTVVVREIHSRKVFITGEVGAAGAYPLTGPLTVMQLIALAGGLTDFANEKRINIVRQSGDGQIETIRFNYESIAEGRGLEQNIRLEPGDTVVVP